MTHQAKGQCQIGQARPRALEFAEFGPECWEFWCGICGILRIVVRKWSNTHGAGLPSSRAGGQDDGSYQTPSN